jgi:hypothetical protein
MFTLHAVIAVLLLVAILWGVVSGESSMTMLWPIGMSLPSFLGLLADADTEHRIVLALVILTAGAVVLVAYAMHAGRTLWLRRRHGRGPRVAAG